MLCQYKGFGRKDRERERGGGGGGGKRKDCIFGVMGDEICDMKVGIVLSTSVLLSGDY